MDPEKNAQSSGHKSETMCVFSMQQTVVRKFKECRQNFYAAFMMSKRDNRTFGDNGGNRKEKKQRPGNNENIEDSVAA